MELEKVYKAIINGRAMLITGSGAHINALNMDREHLPSGGGLAKILYTACGISDTGNSDDLQDAADCYLERKSSEELIAELKKILHVAEIQQEHCVLYGQDWQRVYTTNYDDVPLMSTKSALQPLYPVTLSSNIKLEKEQKKQCVYINGYIGHLNENTLQSEFRLSGKSYNSSDDLNKSPWGAIFSDDLNTVECVVIVGLSLDYDLDLRRLIYTQNVIDKTVFIEQKDISEAKKRKLGRYGTVFPINVEKFTTELEAYKKIHPVTLQNPSIHIYKCFDVAKPKNTMKKATSFDVYGLFMTGQYTDSLWHRTNGKYDNLVYRKSLREVREELKKSCRVIYLHANLGNGKTVFIECIKHLLKNEGYHIFVLKTVYPKALAEDIRKIVETPGKKLVIIENYYNCIDVLEKFSRYSLQNIQFILTARTVLYDTRIKEANEALDIQEGQSRVVDLNKLTENELGTLSSILKNNGLWGVFSGLSDTNKRKRLRKQGNSEFQSILVDIVNSTDMKQKIEQIVSGIKSVSESYYEVLILALLVKIMSLDLSASDISKIMGINIAFDSRFIQNENVLEILDFSRGVGEFRIKSAVTANLILKELDCNAVIIKVLKLTAAYADRYHSISRYENVLKNIISYSHVSTFLLKSGQKECFLVNYYDSLKELDYYKENTFFWLQYAIACANIGKYDLAQLFLENAYCFFRDSEYTIPFQVDTQQARLYLLRIENEKGVDVSDFFQKAHLLLMKPAISNKDNEEKQIQLLYKYVRPEVYKKIPDDFVEQYRLCCGEAYNKVHEYLKKSSVFQSGKDYGKLERKLMKAAALKTVE